MDQVLGHSWAMSTCLMTTNSSLVAHLQSLVLRWAADTVQQGPKEESITAYRDPTPATNVPTAVLIQPCLFASPLFMVAGSECVQREKSSTYRLCPDCFFRLPNYTCMPPQASHRVSPHVHSGTRSLAAANWGHPRARRSNFGGPRLTQGTGSSTLLIILGAEQASKPYEIKRSHDSDQTEQSACPVYCSMMVIIYTLQALLLIDVCCWRCLISPRLEFCASIAGGTPKSPQSCSVLGCIRRHFRCCRILNSGILIIIVS